MTERELQEAVIGTARLLGYRVAHFRAAQTGKGWRTPVEADGAGFPDLVCVHPVMRRLLFCELKARRGKLRSEQAVWIHDLSRIGAPGQNVEVYVWFPEDWLSGQIEQCLRGTKAKQVMM